MSRTIPVFISLFFITGCNLFSEEITNDMKYTSKHNGFANVDFSIFKNKKFKLTVKPIEKDTLSGDSVMTIYGEWSKKGDSLTFKCSDNCDYDVKYLIDGIADEENQSIKMVNENAFRFSTEQKSIWIHGVKCEVDDLSE